MTSNERVARMLDEFAEIHGALGDRHRRLAYERAAASVRATGLTLDAGTPIAEIDALPNVGKSIASKIHELLATGRVRDLEALKREEVPRDLHAFLEIPGVGPKLALRVYREAGVGTLADLERAAASGRILEVRGVSERLRERILHEIPKIRAGGPRRLLLAEARPQAEALLEALRGVEGVEKIAVAGSIRRLKPTIGDVDLVAASRRPEPLVDAFTRLPQVREVVARGEHTHVVLDTGFEADLWVVDPEGWGAALSYATGSREHTLELRTRAQSRGWSLKNERLLDERGRRLPAGDEAALYRSLGLAYVPPELRENRGEIQAAERGEIPALVTLSDLRGDLHVHTNATDGSASLERMVATASEAGREYVCISDHAKGLRVPRGLDEETLLARKEEVRGREFPIPVLVGAEVNILEDGSLGLEERALEALDVVVASVHSGLREPRAKITKRVTDALSTGLVDVLGHPTNRRLPKRPESDIDFERVFEAAHARRVAMEINASPERMDLPGALVQRAKEAGLKFVIDSDAHSPGELAHLEYGVAMARRGWLTREDVLTARDYAGFREWLDRR
jgi:DNA polymerase (family 10)